MSNYYRRRSASPDPSGHTTYVERSGSQGRQYGTIHDGRSTGSRERDRNGRGGRGGGFGFGRGGGRGDGGGSGGSSNVNLPESVPIPSTGNALYLNPRTTEGTAGELIHVLTNHFEVQSIPGKDVEAYDLSITTGEKGEKSKELQENVIARVLSSTTIQRAVRSKIGAKAVWDGVSIVYSTERLPLPSDPFFFEINEGPRRVFYLSIRHRDRVNMDQLRDFIESLNNTADVARSFTLSDSPGAYGGLVLLNTILRSEPARTFASGIGAKSTTYYDRGGNAAYALPCNPALEAWSGFFQAAAIRFGKLTVNVDIATNAFIKPGINLIDLLCSFTGTSRDRLNKADPKALSKLKGIRFYTKHLQRDLNIQDRQVRVVSGIEQKGARHYMFEWKQSKVDDDGLITNHTETIDVETYFKKIYNIRLRFADVPLIKIKGNINVIPMELCYVSDNERYKHELKGPETADFIKHATVPAFARKEKIRENVSKVAWHKNQELLEFGISVNPQFMKVEARILPTPTPQFRAGTDRYPPSTGRWNLKGKVFIVPKTIGAWGILFFNTPGSRSGNTNGSIEKIRHELPMILGNHGVKTDSRSCVVQQADVQGNMMREVSNLYSKIKEQCGKRPDLIVIGLHDTAAELYNELKHICEVKAGVASQAILLSKFSSQRNSNQYLSNVCLKINVKLGGCNSIITDDYFKKNNVMLIGADTSHPAAGDENSPTITALTGTWDKQCQRYTAVTGKQTSRQESIDDFGGLAKLLLNRYKDANMREPDKILYFRDGVSESQYLDVMNAELRQLQEVTRAKITVIICTKRHHTRFFPVGQGTADKLGNARPGTVVENNGGKDIFLVAHPGLQGTVRPTRYTTIYDDNGLDANTIQRICNNICYSYARATTAVSLVPPVYYADLACARAKAHIEVDDYGKPHLMQVAEQLSSTMWWQ